MKSVALIACLFLLPSVCLSQTLCRAPEVDYFSCKTTTNEKIVSVCGNIASEGIGQGGWLQFRFGKMGATELTYPTDRHDSFKKFEGNYFNKYGVVDLRFISGKTLYSVSLNGKYSGADARRRNSPSGGLTMQRGMAKLVSMSCQKINTQKYFQIYSDLNVSLRAYNGETDFLGHFYKYVSK
ncbi:hypothetical protein [Simplicispira psychrophila]|uniref:hypothetical protein n=1 Tax=Simplicispira psychrophila TaxID=80882 RepID=UPI000481B83E|nr:hypothetical protein [Simplicispira psychrophila]